MGFDDGIFGLYSRLYENRREVELSLEDYLRACSDEPSYYAGAAERLLKAIGEPVMVDTSQDPRLGRIFMNRTIKIYPAFEDFYGMEETIERIVGFFRHAAQGLEERKQVLYLLGPVGGGKSSLAERLKLLMEKEPIYALKAGDEISPVFESPLGLFDPITMGPALEERYGIPRRRLTGTISPWAVKRLDEFGGDITKFTVVRLTPSRLKQICVAKTEPGDENNQDVASLVGKVDIRKLEMYSQNDPDAYSFSGGLNRTTQGLMEFVEMFKAPIKMLHPLLTATQEGNYAGTENIGGIPFRGSSWRTRTRPSGRASRTTRTTKLLSTAFRSSRCHTACAPPRNARSMKSCCRAASLRARRARPSTLDILSRFCVLSRLKSHENSNLYSKMRVYDGESLKDTDPRAKSVQEYRDAGGVDEGMDGISTRFAFKVLSSTFNFDTQEVAADPVHLMYVLEQQIWREQFPEEIEKTIP